MPGTRLKFSPMTLLFAALGGGILLFIVAPIAGMFLHCSAAGLVDTASEAEVRESIFLTLWTSMAATLFFAIAAIPFAWLLARKSFPGAWLVNGVVNIPLVIPHSAAGIAVLGVISRETLLGRSAEAVGLSFVSSPLGIMAAMAFVSLPLLIGSARDGFAAVPVRLEKAALVLGASPIRVFFTVSLPLARRAIVSGLVMMWARGMSEFGAVVIIAYRPMITPILIYERFGAFGLKYARPVAAIFVGICLIVLIVIRLLCRERKNAQR